MRSLALSVLVIGACAELALALYGYGPNMGFGLGHGMGLGMGHGMGHGPMMGHDLDSEILNCFASFEDDTGAIANEIAVNIIPKASSGYGMGHMGGMGMGLGYGDYGMGQGLGYGMGHGDGQGNGLSAKIELKSNVAGGTGFVVFTERANTNDGCKPENFGNILTGSRGGQGAGYGMDGYGYGGSGYGYGGLGGGYGYGGLGFTGIGYGNGFGLGHGFGSMFGHNQGAEEGVVAELNITPGAIASALVDKIDFSLRELAGRGVVVCSSVSVDWDWRPVCEEPYFSCCALKYDNMEVSIVDV